MKPTAYPRRRSGRTNWSAGGINRNSKLLAGGVFVELCKEYVGQGRITLYGLYRAIGPQAKPERRMSLVVVKVHYKILPI
jgi:hypothetical protein